MVVSKKWKCGHSNYNCPYCDTELVSKCNGSGTRETTYCENCKIKYYRNRTVPTTRDGDVFKPDTTRHLQPQKTDTNDISEKTDITTFIHTALENDLAYYCVHCDSVHPITESVSDFQESGDLRVEGRIECLCGKYVEITNFGENECKCGRVYLLQNISQLKESTLSFGFD